MVALTERYSSDEFAVLAFPCNQFGGQEPGTPDEILAFAGKYGATFPMFEKVDVNGPNTCVRCTLIRAPCALRASADSRKKVPSRF